MLRELTKLIKHTTVYGVGNALAKMVGFFMLPFYTHYLTPSDYGTLELLDLTLTLTAIVLSTWMNVSIVRHYYDYAEPKDRDQTVSTVLVLALIIGSIGAMCGIYFSRALSIAILKTPELHFYVSLISVSFLMSSVNAVSTSYLRAKQRSALVVGSDLFNLVLTLSLNIYFIAYRHVGVAGVLYSSLTSNTLITLALTTYTLRQVRLSFSYDKLKRVVAFGLPLITTSIAAFTVNFSDRFFLRQFAGVSTVGIYALGYKFGFMISLLVVQPFDMIWQARSYDIRTQADSGQIFSRVFQYYCLALVTAALGLSLIIKELISAISAPPFHSAYQIVPIICLAYIFQGMNRYLLTGTYIAKKTIYLGVVGLINALVNVGLNLFLIPRYGMLGAAWATACSFFIMAALAYSVSQRLYPIPYRFSKVVMVITPAILVYIASRFLVFSSLVITFSTKLLLFAAFPAMVFLLGFFDKPEVEKAKELVLGAWARCRFAAAVVPGE